MKRNKDWTKATDEQRLDEFSRRFSEYINGLTSEVYSDTPEYGLYITFQVLSSGIVDHMDELTLARWIKEGRKTRREDAGE